MAPTSGSRTLPLATAVLLVGFLTWIALRPGDDDSSIGAAAPEGVVASGSDAVPAVEAHGEHDAGAIGRTPSVVDGAPDGSTELSPSAPAEAGEDSDQLRVTVLDPYGGLAEDVAVAVTRREARGTQILDLAYQSRSDEVERGHTGPDGVVAFRLPVGRTFELVVPAEGSGDLVPQQVGCRAGEEVTVRLGLGGRARGLVTDPAGAPLAGATVEVWRDPRQAGHTARVETDADGRYDLRGLPTSSFMLLVSAEGFGKGFSDLLEIPPGTQVERDFQLERGLRVRGRVVDRKTREPIPNAEIGHSPLWKWSVRTDAEGLFELAGVDPMTPTQAVVYVRADGWAATEAWVKVAEIEDEILVRLRSGARVEGRVVDGNGTPVSGAFVYLFGTTHVRGQQSIDSLSRWTGEDGSFDFTGVRTDMGHTLLVRAPGYGATLTPLERTLRDQDLGEVTLAAEARILGRVIGPGGGPIPDAEVVLRGDTLEDEMMRAYLETWEVFSDSHGTFLFEGLPAGDYGIEASVKGNQERTRKDLTLAPGSWVDDLVLEFRVVGGEIQGVVLLPDGSPAASSVVWLAGLDGSETAPLRTDLDGRFTFRGLRQGAYGLRALPPRDHGTTAYEVRLTGVEPDDGEVTLQLLEGAPVTGIVLTAEGAPASGAEIAASLEGATIDWTRADADGAFILTVPAGSEVDLRATPAPDRSERWVSGGEMVEAVAFAPIDPPEEPDQAVLTGVAAGSAGVVLQL